MVNSDGDDWGHIIRGTGKGQPVTQKVVPVVAITTTAGTGTEALKEMQKNCGVDTLKMSAYGIKKDEPPKLAQNAFDTMGWLFELDRYTLSFEDAVSILEDAHN